METNQNLRAPASWSEPNSPARELSRKSRESICDLCQDFTRGAYHGINSSEFIRKISSESEFYADLVHHDF